MYQKTLQNSGLTQSQAEILNFLFQNKESKASIIAKKLKRPRGAVYKSLEELITLNLVARTDKANMVSIFRAEHPGKIEKFFEKQENNIRKNKSAYLSILPDMISDFNLSSNKPGIKFLEGNDGIKKVINDTLKSKTTVYTFIDAESLKDDKILQEINKEYIKKREKRKLNKKIIAPKSSQNFFSNLNINNTKIKFLKDNSIPFKSGLQIYDNKVSFQTINNKNKIALIIEDENIFKMHKLLFEYIWRTLD